MPSKYPIFEGPDAYLPWDQYKKMSKKEKAEREKRKEAFLAENGQLEDYKAVKKQRLLDKETAHERKLAKQRAAMDEIFDSEKQRQKLQDARKERGFLQKMGDNPFVV